MLVLGIDPGKHIGVALYDSDEKRVVNSITIELPAVNLYELNWKTNLSPLVRIGMQATLLAVEEITSIGTSVTTETMRTAQQVGYFFHEWHYMERLVIPRHGYWAIRNHGKRLPGVKQFFKAKNDSEVNRAVKRYLDPECRFGKHAKGTKANPGPAYGVSGSHEWAALAVAITAFELQKEVSK